MGCRPDFGVAVLAGQFSGGGSVFKRKPELGRTRDGAAGLFVGPMRRRRPDKNGTLAVDQEKLDPRRQVLDLLLHQPVEIERGQKHEPQLPLFIVSRIGNLEHSRPGEPAECRLDRRPIGVRQRALEVPAITQVEDPSGVQRVAEQAAVGVDGQDAGKIRVLLENFGEEFGAGGLVAAAEIARPGQAEMELGRSLNLGVDTRRNTARRRRQAADRSRDLLASILIITPADKDSGHKQGSKDQQQQPDADTHGGHTRGLGDPETRRLGKIAATRSIRRDHHLAAAMHETVAISMRRYPSIDLRPVNLQVRNFTDRTRVPSQPRDWMAGRWTGRLEGRASIAGAGG